MIIIPTMNLKAMKWVLSYYYFSRWIQTNFRITQLLNMQAALGSARPSLIPRLRWSQRRLKVSTDVLSCDLYQLTPEFYRVWWDIKSFILYKYTTDKNSTHCKPGSFHGKENYSWLWKRYALRWASVGRIYTELSNYCRQNRVCAGKD